MFDFLKKKITNFTDKLKGSVQKTGEEPREIQEEIEEPIPEKIETQKKETREIPEKTMEREVADPGETEEIDTAGENKEAIEKVKKIRKDDKRELKAQVGLGKKLFGFIGGKIKISENETKEFFNEFELSLLESDVEQETAEAITNELRERLIGKEISA